MKSFSKVAALAALLGVLDNQNTVSAAPSLGGYYETWSAKCVWWPEVYCDLANVASYMDNIFISFASPQYYNYDPAYANSLGFNFPTASSKAFQLSIIKLRQKNPSAKIFISVGGATYTWPSKMSDKHFDNILKFVDQYDLDGIDLDYEKNPYCYLIGGQPACQTDSELTTLITDFGEALAKFNEGREKRVLLSAAPFSVGAYYYGDYVNAKPKGSYNGMWVNPLKAAGQYLDMLNIMSYDAGPYTFQDTSDSSLDDYNPLEAYKAYRAIYQGIINIGIEIPPEAWGGNEVTSDHIKQIAAGLDKSSDDGLFVWSLHKPSGETFSVSDIIEQMCSELGKTDCTTQPGELPPKSQAEAWGQQQITDFSQN